MKRIVGLLLVLAASIAVIVGGSTSDGKAFTDGSIFLSGSQWHVTITPIDNDGGTGNDFFCAVCYNANGTIYDIDIITRRDRNIPCRSTGAM